MKIPQTPIIALARSHTLISQPTHARIAIHAHFISIYENFLKKSISKHCRDAIDPHLCDGFPTFPISFTYQVQILATFEGRL